MVYHRRVWYRKYSRRGEVDEHPGKNSRGRSGRMLYEEIMGPGGTAELRARAGATFGTISALHEAWKCGSLPSNAQERAKELLELASKNRQHGPHPLAEIDVGHELWKLHHEYPWQDGYAIRNHIGALW